jgi:hypothetical protein
MNKSKIKRIHRQIKTAFKQEKRILITYELANQPKNTGLLVTDIGDEYIEVKTAGIVKIEDIVFLEFRAHEPEVVES